MSSISISSGGRGGRARRSIGHQYNQYNRVFVRDDQVNTIVETAEVGDLSQFVSKAVF